MEFTNFITKDMLITWMMTIVIVELIVGFTKELPFIKKIPTKGYTMLVALFHLLIINFEMRVFDPTVFGQYLLVCNAIVISVVLTGGYSIITGEIVLNKAGKKSKA